MTRDISTSNMAREKRLGQTLLFNIWVVRAMARTSAQPQVELSLLRNISFFKIDPGLGLWVKDWIPLKIKKKYELQNFYITNNFFSQIMHFWSLTKNTLYYKFIQSY
jgi:hypothetical protein